MIKKEKNNLISNKKEVQAMLEKAYHVLGVVDKEEYMEIKRELKICKTMKGLATIIDDHSINTSKLSFRKELLLYFTK